jgi:hypothetical protein
MTGRRIRGLGQLVERGLDVQAHHLHLEVGELTLVAPNLSRHRFQYQPCCHHIVNGHVAHYWHPTVIGQLWQ